jgi:hypothetical protein
MVVGTTDNMVLTFPGFDLTGLLITDIRLTDNVGVIRNLASGAGVNTWGVVINIGAGTITFRVPTSGTGGYSGASMIFINIGINAGGTHQIKNPSSMGSITETIVLNNTGSGEMGSMVVPIVDSDQVNVTGFVSAYMYFDIDTNTDNSDCAFSVCKAHSGAVGSAANYTVDLGELKSTYLNKSQNSVTHSDGLPGIINSIYFDLTTNAISGAVIRVISANGGLQGPPTNLITSIADGQNILMNSGTYGFNLPVAGTAKHGSFVANSSCNTASTYCGAVTSGMKDVYTTGGHPIDAGRARMDIAAGASYVNNPGTYTDTLTFVATATF